MLASEVIERGPRTSVNVQSFRHIGRRPRMSVFGGSPEAGEVRVPLHGHERLLARVAVLASGHDIAAHAATAAAERHDVIHAQGSVADLAPAVVADPVGDAALPPLARAQLTGALALTLEETRVERRVELTHGPTAPRRAPPTPASATPPAPRRSCAPSRPSGRARRPGTAPDR